jgi:hypothetical protein
MGPWDIASLIIGLVLGYITNEIVSIKYRNKELKIEAWNYVFERASRIIKLKRALHRALENNKLENYESVSDILHEIYNYSYRKEFKWISANQYTVINNTITDIAKLAEALSLYIEYKYCELNKKDNYKLDKQKVLGIINDNHKKIEEVYESLPSYHDLLIDKRYYN